MEEEVAFLSPDARHVVVSVNPKAGAESADGRVAHLVELLRQEGMEATILSNLDEVAAESNRLFAEGRLRALVAVGGDGTVAELVNRTMPGLPLTVLPAGNENLLARHFVMGSAAEQCCRTVVDGAVVQRDAGRAGNRIFLVMVSCGFDAEVVHSLHLHRTGHVTSASYFQPLMASIRYYDYPELRVYWSEDGFVPPQDGGGENAVTRQTTFLAACIGCSPLTCPVTGRDCRSPRRLTVRTACWTSAHSARAAYGTVCITPRRSSLAPIAG